MLMVQLLLIVDYNVDIDYFPGYGHPVKGFDFVEGVGAPVCFLTACSARPLAWISVKGKLDAKPWAGPQCSAEDFFLQITLSSNFLITFTSSLCSLDMREKKFYFWHPQVMCCLKRRKALTFLVVDNCQPRI